MESTCDLSAHAYLVRGGADALVQVVAMLEKTGIETKGNPDVLIRTYSSFTIDDARSLRERASLHAVGKTGRLFIIVAPTIAADAQNALLKTFEEPPAGARFFLIVSSPQMLLPTLRSRMQGMDVARATEVTLVDVPSFFKATGEKRLEMLKPLLEKGEDDKRDMAGTLSFLAEVEYALSSKPREHAIGLRAVYRARKYITDRGALAKSLLEQTALAIPKVL